MHTLNLSSHTTDPKPVTAWKPIPSWVVLIAGAAVGVALLVSWWGGPLAIVSMFLGQESSRVVVSCVDGQMWATPASRLAKLLGRQLGSPEPLASDQVARRRSSMMHDTWTIDGTELAVSTFKRREMQGVIAAASATRAATAP